MERCINNNERTNEYTAGDSISEVRTIAQPTITNTCLREHNLFFFNGPHRPSLLYQI